MNAVSLRGVVARGSRGGDDNMAKEEREERDDEDRCIPRPAGQRPPGHQSYPAIVDREPGESLNLIKGYTLNATLNTLFLIIFILLSYLFLFFFF